MNKICNSKIQIKQGRDVDQQATSQKAYFRLNIICNVCQHKRLSHTIQRQTKHYVKQYLHSQTLGKTTLDHEFIKIFWFQFLFYIMVNHQILLHKLAYRLLFGARNFLIGEYLRDLRTCFYCIALANWGSIVDEKSKSLLLIDKLLQSPAIYYILA